MARFLRLRSQRQTYAHGDRYKNMMTAVKGHGYHIEKHFYKTADDYINCVFRIPGPKNTQKHKTNHRPVIVMQHGMNDSSQFAMDEGMDSIALIFAESGYDVWLNNSRGNLYSRNHKYLDPDYDEEFWDYSFVELGKFD